MSEAFIAKRVAFNCDEIMMDTTHYFGVQGLDEKARAANLAVAEFKAALQERMKHERV